MRVLLLSAALSAVLLAPTVSRAEHRPDVHVMSVQALDQVVVLNALQTTLIAAHSLVVAEATPFDGLAHSSLSGPEVPSYVIRWNRAALSQALAVERFRSKRHSYLSNVTWRSALARSLIRLRV